MLTVLPSLIIPTIPHTERPRAYSTIPPDAFVRKADTWGEARGGCSLHAWCPVSVGATFSHLLLLLYRSNSSASCESNRARSNCALLRSTGPANCQLP